jgi:hypothetical protein
MIREIGFYVAFVLSICVSMCVLYRRPMSIAPLMRRTAELLDSSTEKPELRFENLVAPEAKFYAFYMKWSLMG